MELHRKYDGVFPVLRYSRELSISQSGHGQMIANTQSQQAGNPPNRVEAVKPILKPELDRNVDLDVNIKCEAPLNRRPRGW